MAYLTTKQAAERRGVHRSRILALIREGRLKATKLGWEWLIEESDLDNLVLYRHGYPTGKPRKVAEKEETAE